MKKVIGYFFQGLLYIAPLIVTIYILYKSFIFLDSILPFEIPGLGIVAILVSITLLGYIGSLYFAKPLFSFFERFVERAPLVKIIYSSVKDLTAAFVGEKKRFNQPVLVVVNKESNIERIGFITRSDLSELGLGKEKIAVYLPFSYSIAGSLIIVSRDNITPLKASGTEMMKFVISGGVTEI